jgi:hypothetical protein
MSHSRLLLGRASERFSDISPKILSTNDNNNNNNNHTYVFMYLNACQQQIFYDGQAH